MWHPRHPRYPRPRPRPRPCPLPHTIPLYLRTHEKRTASNCEYETYHIQALYLNLPRTGESQFKTLTSDSSREHTVRWAASQPGTNWGQSRPLSRPPWAWASHPPTLRPSDPPPLRPSLPSSSRSSHRH